MAYKKVYDHINQVLVLPLPCDGTSIERPLLDLPLGMVHVSLRGKYCIDLICHPDKVITVPPGGRSWTSFLLGMSK